MGTKRPAAASSSQAATAKAKKSKAKSAPASVHQLRITLREIEPAVWRRVAVSSSTSLAALHRILNAAMGWQDCHLHELGAGGRRYGPLDPEADDELEDERRARLAGVAGAEGARLVYRYDFGDSWEHDVVVERVGPPEPGVSYPACLGGARACPPEDCGGTEGYQEVVGALCGAPGERTEELLEWLEEGFDPEAFELPEVERRIRRAGR